MQTNDWSHPDGIYVANFTYKIIRFVGWGNSKLFVKFADLMIPDQVGNDELKKHDKRITDNTFFYSYLRRCSPVLQTLRQGWSAGIQHFCNTRR